MRRISIVGALAAIVTGLVPTGAGAQELPPAPPRQQWYAANDFGYWSDGSQVRVDEACQGIADEAERVACSLEAFRARPFVVIALTDTGINPYHQEFRAPEFTHHPSTFIEGYPAAPAALDVSLDVADSSGYQAAVDADADLWGGVAGNRLYWIPGTRIIGAYSSIIDGDNRILDDNGHGTGTSSVSAGRWYGSNNNALIVMVEGLGDAPLNWAMSQPWIDIVTNSWGPSLGGLSTGSATASRDATRRGQSVLFSAGNGMRNTNSSEVWGPVQGATGVGDPCDCKLPNSNLTITSHNKGPSWILAVGAASPVNGQSHWWHGIPPDVSSFGSKWRAAAHNGVLHEQNRDFGGTSNASPVTAGVLSAVIQKAREVLGDTVAGQKTGAVVAQAATGVVPPTTGPLSDGKLTRAEAEDIVLKTAQPVPFDPTKASWDYAIYPTTPLYFTYQGYGIVDKTSKAAALKVLMGEQPMPVRTEVDAWMAQLDAARNAVYGQP
jgi:hypothetical protein